MKMNFLYFINKKDFSKKDFFVSFFSKKDFSKKDFSKKDFYNILLLEIIFTNNPL
jgi:hypothetical protein